MLPNISITYIDNNNKKNYFRSVDSFLQYLEFNSGFPGLFYFETNNSLYRWDVQYSTKHTYFTFVQLMDFTSGKCVISSYDKISKSFIINPPFWWLTNPDIVPEIIPDIIPDNNEFPRDYVNTSIWYVSSENKWYGYDGVHSKSYVSPNLKDVLPAILIYWPPTEYDKLTIIETQ